MEYHSWDGRLWSWWKNTIFRRWSHLPTNLRARIFKKMLRKTIADNQRDRHDWLPEALWSYQTSVRHSIPIPLYKYPLLFLSKAQIRREKNTTSLLSIFSSRSCGQRTTPSTSPSPPTSSSLVMCDGGYDSSKIICVWSVIVWINITISYYPDCGFEEGGGPESWNSRLLNTMCFARLMCKCKILILSDGKVSTDSLLQYPNYHVNWDNRSLFLYLYDVLTT